MSNKYFYQFTLIKKMQAHESYQNINSFLFSAVHGHGKRIYCRYCKR